MRIEVYIQELSTYDKNTLHLDTTIGSITAHLVDMSQWDRLYDLLNKRFTVVIVNQEGNEFWIKLV
jgi:hypothetical protein